VQLGAFNYLQKPLDLKQLRTITEGVAESSKLRRINRDKRRQIPAFATASLLWYNVDESFL
jgi:DNA-binding NtrC family response regulator